MEDTWYTSLPLDWVRMIKQKSKMSDISNKDVVLGLIEEFSLSRRSLGDIPEVVAHMKNLKELDLSGNYFKNSVIEEDMLPKKLKILNLAGCGVKQIESLPTSLEILDLGYNDLEEVPKAIEKLSQLKVLSLSGNNISKLSPDIKLPNSLTYLDLSDNKISRIQSPECQEIRVCSAIKLTGNPLEHISVRLVTGTSRVTSLSLDDPAPSLLDFLAKARRKGVSIEVF